MAFSPADTFPGMKREDQADCDIDTITEPSVFKVYASNIDDHTEAPSAMDDYSGAAYRTYTLLLEPEPEIFIIRQKSGLIQILQRTVCRV